MNYEMGGTNLSITVKEKVLGVTMNANTVFEPGIEKGETHVSPS